MNELKFKIYNFNKYSKNTFCFSFQEYEVMAAYTGLIYTNNRLVCNHDFDCVANIIEARILKRLNKI